MTTDVQAPAPLKSCWTNSAIEGVFIYYVSTLLVFAGVSFGNSFVIKQHHPNSLPPGFLNSMANWDGFWYSQIAREGYFYSPDRQSSVAFFPLYPLLGRSLAGLTSLSHEIALIVISNVSCCVACILLHRYVHVRGPKVEGSNNAAWSVIAFSAWPLSMFCRMAYSESLFILLAIACLMILELRRHWFFAAILCALATATRPVGVALIPVILLHIAMSNTSRLRKMISAAVALPVSCSGLALYMLYQYLRFGDLFAFSKTQVHWSGRTSLSTFERLVQTLALEPVWSKYTPSSEAYWAKYEQIDNPLFSLEFANPIFFVVVALLVSWGCWRRVLTANEGVLSAFLLLIPYALHSHRAMMTAHGRYALSAFPAFIVLGFLLSRLPAPISTLLVAACAFMLAAYSALFATWYRIY